MKKQLFSVMMIGALLSSSLYANAAFTDVSSSTQTKLDYLISKGVVAGENSTFRPADLVNRAESLKLILAASQLQLDMTATGSSFKDVVANSWYAAYVNTAIKFGIVKGYADGTFKPEQKVNKGEFVTLLYRMHSTLRDNEYVDTAMQYSDVRAADWFATPAAWSKSFLGGSTFGAEKELNREQTAEIVYAYMTHYKVDKKLAFGTLNLVANTSQSGGGGGGMGMSRPMTESGEVMSGTTMPDMKDPAMPYPYPYYNYITEYEYTGPALADFPASVDVVKAINSPNTPVTVSGLFEGLGSVAKVFSTMSSVELGYATFIPAVKDGFMYSVDRMYGTFGISVDWRGQPTNYDYFSPLTSEPVDSEVIAVANKFLVDKGISTVGYGAPVVDNSWKLYRMEGDTYIPNYYTVYYPKLVEGTPLYGSGGYYDQALSVSVSLPSKVVTNVNGFIPKLEVVSQYDTKKWSDIVEEATNMYNGDYSADIPEGAEVITQTTKVTLTSARKVMMSVYDYSKTDANGNAALHYVPAVLFSGTSVTTSTDGSEPYTNKDVKVVVPAVSDPELQNNYYPMG